MLGETYGKGEDDLFSLNKSCDKIQHLGLEEMEILDDAISYLHKVSRGRYPDKSRKRTKNKGATFSRRLDHLLQEQIQSSKNVAGVSLGKHYEPLSMSTTFIEREKSTLDLNKSQSAKVGLKSRQAWDYHSHFPGELYTVKWEPQLLRKLHDSVKHVMKEVSEHAAAEILKHTVLHTMVSAISMSSALMHITKLIDGPWVLALARADEAGVLLANSFLDPKAGHRPVNLIGFSMGARIVYSCLKELARHQEIWEKQQEMKDANCGEFCGRIGNSSERGTPARSRETVSTYVREPAGIIEDAILMGLPADISKRSWVKSRQICSGRLINCFCPNDLILSIMFRYERMSMLTNCGTSAVKVDGVENYDVSHLISSHSDYCVMAKDILHLVKFGEPSPVGVNTF